MSEPNPERAIAEAILGPAGLSAAGLGLRFDRVVCRVLGDLRSFVDAAAPTGLTVVLTLTAPIRLPARTVDALKQQIETLLSDGPGERSVAVHGNDAQVRLIRLAAAPRLVGLVHNRGAETGRLLELAERWLRAGAPGAP